MATIPPNSMQAAQRCRQLHQRQHMRTRTLSEPASVSSVDASPACTPESTPPASPRKFESLLSMGPLSKLYAIVYGSGNIPSGQDAGTKESPLLVHQTTTGAPEVKQVTEVGASASGLTQSLEASHHTSSITSMT